ncbi:phage baseplate protein [Acidaminococcus intestini]|uniref:phage baseplate protein n=2 Tax=Acidaminococcus intestini TaxID=187327 RepID=UPI00040A8B1A|nr:hypothetical protein [Acidaminococcus intestini]
MTTRAIVPNGDGEGSLGIEGLNWGAMYVSSPEKDDNSQKVPTTAWVQKLLADALAKQKAAYEQAISTAVSAAQTKAKLDAHPVGSYYFSDKSTSPADLFGGTWEALPAGYTLIAQGSGTDDFGSFNYVAGTKYGERMHKLTTDEMPSHGHRIALAKGGFPQTEPQSILYNAGQSNNSINGTFTDRKVSGYYADGNHGYYFQSEFIEHTGGDAAHNNLQPSVGAYGWRRTA